MLKYSEKILTDSLIKHGYCSLSQMDSSLLKAQQTKDSLYVYLVKSGLVNETQILMALSSDFRMGTIHLKDAVIDRPLIEKVPVKFAGYYKFIPVKLEHKTLTIAVALPLEVKVLDEIRVYLGMEPKEVLTTESDLSDALKKHYGLAADTIDKLLTRDPGKKISAEAELSAAVEDLELIQEDPTVTKIVNQVILEAYQKRATDIHIEPYRNKVRIRYRIDGVLIDANLPADVRHLLLPMLSRIKIMANLSIVEKRLPQDGSAVVKTKDQNLDLRVSTIPTPSGESMVIRILPSKVMVFSLERLGVDPGNLFVLRSLIKKPHGIIFVTGPTGSGKTTTLYACLHDINSSERKIITIEDPVEYEMEGVTQIQVNSKVKLDFAVGLRSILRHDPDVIMVGEVRDLETAEIAIRTALTGHLVFSTLHTNDAASGVTRLVDMGVEPFLVASSVEAFMAQRLVRVVCPKCKEEDLSSPKDIKEEIAASLKIKDMNKIKIYRGKGCDHCNKTGFYGRTAIYEVLVVNEAIRAAILEKAGAETIKQIAIRSGMNTLRKDGWNKVLAGITTPAEVMNVTVKEEISGGVAPAEPLNAPKGFPPSPQMPETVSVRRSLSSDAPERETEFSSRIYPRLKAEVPIRFKFTHFKFTDERNISQDALAGDGVEQSMVTQDISAGGLRFLSRYLIPLGTIMELKIHLTGENRSLDCYAKVCRAEHDTTANTFNIVVYYLDMTSADRVKVNNFVTSRLNLNPKLKLESY